MQQFVSVGLAICEKMEIADRRGQQMIMRFAKLYSPEKLGKVIETAKEYSWWHNNPTAAFMKAIGEVNRAEKAGG